MNYLSTFTGIGGFELGISRVMPSAKCVGYSEINKPAINTYEGHYEHKNYGDITAVTTTELPDFDFIVGGFPCQAFSAAGKRRGFDDTRGTLFFDVARIIADKRPGHFLLENVKGLLNHDGGKTFQTILGVLAELGYDVEWQLFNSKFWDVPQNRERVYIVGHLRNQCTRKVFPIGEPNEQPNKTGAEIRRYSQAVTATYAKGGKGSHVVTVREATKKGYAEAEVGDTINITIPTSKTRRGRVQKQAAGTLQTNESMVTITEDERIRRLMPVECERLQGFPDGWTLGSDTQRYKQCGNAVTVNVVEAVVSALRPCLR